MFKKVKSSPDLWNFILDHAESQHFGKVFYCSWYLLVFNEKIMQVLRKAIAV